MTTSPSRLPPRLCSLWIPMPRTYTATVKRERGWEEQRPAGALALSVRSETISAGRNSIAALFVHEAAVEHTTRRHDRSMRPAEPQADEEGLCGSIGEGDRGRSDRLAAGDLWCGYPVGPRNHADRKAAPICCDPTVPQRIEDGVCLEVELVRDAGPSSSSSLAEPSMRPAATIGDPSSRCEGIGLVPPPATRNDEKSLGPVVKRNPDNRHPLYSKALREVVWVNPGTFGYDGTVRLPAACR
jgi:hypothetical protein